MPKQNQYDAFTCGETEYNPFLYGTGLGYGRMIPTEACGRVHFCPKAFGKILQDLESL